jgi:hypothetical protein
MIANNTGITIKAISGVNRFVIIRNINVQTIKNPRIANIITPPIFESAFITVEAIRLYV